MRSATVSEYNRALRFLKHANAEWKGDFHWDKQPQGPPAGCKEPETLALIAVNQTKHYFHDEWWRMAEQLLVMPAEAMVLAIGAANTAQGDGSTLAEQKRLQDERDHKMNKCQEASVHSVLSKIRNALLYKGKTLFWSPGQNRPPIPRNKEKNPSPRLPASEHPWPVAPLSLPPRLR